MNNSPLSPHRLRIVVVGDVDHGKSTLIGRLLHDTDSLPEEKIAQLKALSEAEGRVFEFAFLLDALREEQAQNITIDTTQIPFRTAKRDYVIIDAPGHREFLKNMMTGAASANAALLLIDVTQGIQDQTRRHLQLLMLLGLRQVIVAINKMDRIDFSREKFESIALEVKKLLSEFSFDSKYIIPIAAKLGFTIGSLAKEMLWYQGSTIVEALDGLEPPASLEELPLRFMIQDVYHDHPRKLIVGRVESGKISVGEEIIFWPLEKKTTLNAIELWNVALPPIEAVAGKSIAVTVEDESILIQRGMVVSHAHSVPVCAKKISVRLFWLEQQPLVLGDGVTIKLGTQVVEALLTSLKNYFEINSSQASMLHVGLIKEHAMADVVFQLKEPLVYDAFDYIEPMGRLVILKNKKIVGVGIILKTNGIKYGDQ